MAKLEYKDLPVYIAHADGGKTDPYSVNSMIDKSVAQGTIKTTVIDGYKAADDAVKNWATQSFQPKS